jgi:hypothetical protein
MWRECFCRCHYDKQVKHVLPCCVNCNYCGKRIAPAGAMKKHLTDAHPGVMLGQSGSGNKKEV